MGSEIEKTKKSGIAFQYNGVDVTFDDQRLISLTDLWKAAGSPDGKEPRRWAQTEHGSGFIADLARFLNSAKNAIWKSRRGKHLSGTWAHWQVALAYAKYLSHEFHRFVNEAFREWAEEKADPDLKIQRAVDSYRRRGHDDDWISTRFHGIVERKAFTSTLKRHQVEGRGFAQCTDAINIKVLGRTASEFKTLKGLPTSARTRDHFDPIQLAQTQLAEAMATRGVQDERAVGNSECTSVCSRAGEAVRKALEYMSQTRIS